MSGHRPRSLPGRLLVAQVVVVVAMALTMIGVAVAVGPRLFDEHLRQAGHGEQPETMAHAEEAFQAAGTSALVVGLLIAVGGAILVSLLLTSRLRSALAELTAAAQRIASGDYEHRVRDLEASAELAQLARNFNQMAARLAATEGTRRRLLTDLAHELRTPIATIEVALESLEDGVLDAGPDTIAMLRGQSERLARLTRDLREVSAAEEGQLDLALERTAVSALVDRAYVAAREEFARKQVELVAEPTATGLMVDVDPGRIGQVLANLLSNSLRHTPSGGRVTLAVRPLATTVRIEVADNGEGIAADHLPHVFERFYRADAARDREHGGSGVGLAISQAIARAHGGGLSVVSAGVGRGATFTLELPRSAS